MIDRREANAPHGETKAPAGRALAGPASPEENGRAKAVLPVPNGGKAGNPGLPGIGRAGKLKAKEGLLGHVGQPLSARMGSEDPLRKPDGMTAGLLGLARENRRNP